MTDDVFNLTAPNVTDPFDVSSPEGRARAQELIDELCERPCREGAEHCGAHEVVGGLKMLATEMLAVLDNEVRINADNYKEEMRLLAALDHRNEMLLTLIRLAFTPKAQANIERFARRLARREQQLADRIHALLPPMNPLRADDELASPERRDPQGGLSEDEQNDVGKVETLVADYVRDPANIGADDFGDAFERAMLLLTKMFRLVRRLSSPASSAVLNGEEINAPRSSDREYLFLGGYIADQLAAGHRRTYRYPDSTLPEVVVESQDIESSMIVARRRRADADDPEEKQPEQSSESGISAAPCAGYELIGFEVSKDKRFVVNSTHTKIVHCPSCSSAPARLPKE